MALAGAVRVMSAWEIRRAPGYSPMSTMTLRSTGTQPPALPVPAPRATRPRPSALARRTSSRRAAGPCGLTTARGRGPTRWDSSWRKGSSCSGRSRIVASGRCLSASMAPVCYRSPGAAREKLVHQRSFVVPVHGVHEAAGLHHVEDQDRQVVLPAEGDGGGIHDLQVLLQDFLE